MQCRSYLEGNILFLVSFVQVHQQSNQLLVSGAAVVFLHACRPTLFNLRDSRRMHASTLVFLGLVASRVVVRCMFVMCVAALKCAHVSIRLCDVLVCAQVCIVLGLPPSWLAMQSLLEDDGLRERLVALRTDSVQACQMDCLRMLSLCLTCSYWLCCAVSNRLVARTLPPVCCSVWTS